MTGALACLHDWLQHPLDDADLIVGTSAGSVLTAALRCGATVEEMAAWKRGDAAGILGESAALAAQDGPFPPLPRLRFGSAPLAAAALLRPDLVPPWVDATAWLPHGRGQHATVRALVTGLHGRHRKHPGKGAAPLSWADGRTWIAATDYDTGQRVLFGREGGPAGAAPRCGGLVLLHSRLVSAGKDRRPPLCRRRGQVPDLTRHPGSASRTRKRCSRRRRRRSPPPGRTRRSRPGPTPKAIGAMSGAQTLDQPHP
jgi:hypothetical protein